MGGTGPTRASGPPSRRRTPVSTRSGPPWGGSTARSGIGTWCAPARPWRRTRRKGARMPAPTWHLWLDVTPRAGYRNMAIDSALLALAERDGTGFVRLYRWFPACISFGRHESAARRYDRVRIEGLGLDVVRRPTGGRA